MACGEMIEMIISDTYLLPCSCGRKIPVQLRQAGETLACECGASLEVPKLSGIKKLEQAEPQDAPKPAREQWSLGHGMIFVGGLFIICAIGFAAWLLWAGPSDPYATFTPEAMIETAKTRNPVQSLRMWRLLERSGLEHHKRGEEIRYEDELAGHNVLWWVWCPLPAIGVGLVVGGCVVLNLKKRRAERKAKAAGAAGRA